MVRLPTVFLAAILSIYSFCDLANSDVTEQSSQSSFCFAIGNAASASYIKNVNLLLSDFVSQADLISFYNSSVGESPNVAFGYYMCRGDLQPQACRCCIEEVRDNYKTSSCEYPSGIYFSDMCILRYTNHSTYGMWERGTAIARPIGVKVSNYNQYHETLSATLDSLIDEAAFGNNSSSVLGYATKEAEVTGDEKIYSLAQCTPDIVGANCSMCLRDVLSDLQSSFDGYEGARMITEKCLLKYNNQPFYGPEALEPNKGDGVRPPSIMIICFIVLLLLMYSV